LVLAGGGGGMWLQRYYADTRRGTEAALDTAAGLRDAARWAAALDILEQAEARLGAGGAADLRRRVAQARDDLQLAKRLDAIRQHRSTIVHGTFDTWTANQDYKEAFWKAGLGEEGEDAAAVAARVRASRIKAQLVAALDDWVLVAASNSRRTWLLAVARAADPDDWCDRFRDPAVWRDRTALEELACELLCEEKLGQLRPQPLAALGQALVAAKGDAVPLLAAAQARHPNDFWLSFLLGNALSKVKRWDEAVGYYRAALAVRPEAAVAHTNLGSVLVYKKQPDEAIREYRRAIALDPKDATPHYGLGVALHDKGDVDGAITEYRQAIALDHKYAGAHNNLGITLMDKGQLEEAIQEFRTVIALDHKDAEAHNNLGIALATKGQLDEAIRAFRTAIDLDPEYPQAHGALGQVFLQQGRFAEARDATRRCLELLPPGHPQRQLAPRQLQQCDQALALESKLDAILGGKEKPADDAERLDLARLGQLPFKKLYAASARFYSEAFANDATLADDLQAQHRYNAACAAALAGCGQGKDAEKLDGKERARLRIQAPDWLRADLAHWAKEAESDKPEVRLQVQKTLTHWQTNPDLAGLRDKDALEKLPDAERDACRKLWADVAAVLVKVRDK
jgi:Flp pilus assembly protein TadD